MRVTTSSSSRRGGRGGFLLAFLLVVAVLVNPGKSFSPNGSTRLSPVSSSIYRSSVPLSFPSTTTTASTASTPSITTRSTVPIQLGSTTSDDNDATPADDKPEKRKKRVAIGYQTITLLYSLAAIFHILKKGVAFWSLYYACGGPLLAAGTAYVLQGAVNADHLPSDTYKRLNLSLLVFGIMGLSLPILDGEHFKTIGFIIPPLITTINSIKGYGYGVLGLGKKQKVVSSIVNDLKSGVEKTIKGILKIKKESLDYILATALVLCVTGMKFKETLELLGDSSSSPLMVASRVSRLARLCLFSGVMYTLKDAADRDRLSGTTFIQLNYLSSIVFFTMSGYLCPNLKPTLLGAAALLFSGITAWNGYSKAQAKKK